MKMAALIAITFVQMMLLPPARSEARGTSSMVAVQADPGASSGLQRIAADGLTVPKLDINVNVGDAPASRTWYAQPIWIAVFVIGGIAVLTLLVMALRGSGSGGGSTVVKV